MGNTIDYSDPLELMQELSTYNPPKLWKIFDRIMQTMTESRAELLRRLADQCLPVFNHKLDQMNQILEDFEPLYSDKRCTTKMNGILIATNFSKRQHAQMAPLIGTLFNTKSDLIRFMIGIYVFRVMDDPAMDWTRVRTQL